MLKITTLLLLSICVACGGGQKPDGTNSERSNELAPLPGENAQAETASGAPAAKDDSAKSDAQKLNEGKKPPTDEQKQLLAQAEADLGSMVEKICACKDKPCLEALQTEFQSFGVKYKSLEDIQIPEDVVERMMLLGQRVTECTKKIAGS